MGNISEKSPFKTKCIVKSVVQNINKFDFKLNISEPHEQLYSKSTYLWAVGSGDTEICQ